jgi:hypothetical protein
MQTRGKLNDTSWDAKCIEIASACRPQLGCPANAVTTKIEIEEINPPVPRRTNLYALPIRGVEEYVAVAPARDSLAYLSIGQTAGALRVIISLLVSEAKSEVDRSSDFLEHSSGLRFDVKMDTQPPHLTPPG